MRSSSSIGRPRRHSDSETALGSGISLLMPVITSPNAQPRKASSVPDVSLKPNSASLAVNSWSPKRRRALRFGADDFHFFADPRIDGGRRQRVGGCPCRAVVLKRDRRKEHAGARAIAPALARARSAKSYRPRQHRTRDRAAASACSVKWPSRFQGSCGRQSSRPRAEPSRFSSPLNRVLPNPRSSQESSPSATRNSNSMKAAQIIALARESWRSDAYGGNAQQQASEHRSGLGPGNRGPRSAKMVNSSSTKLRTKSRSEAR